MKRYHCQLLRTVFLGKPTQTFLDAEQTVLEGMEVGLEKARVGNTCEDIAIVCFDIRTKYDITKDNRTMSLRPGDMTVLKENKTFNFMT